MRRAAPLGSGPVSRQLKRNECNVTVMQERRIHEHTACYTDADRTVLSAGSFRRPATAAARPFTSGGRIMFP